jgi:hypothetical protein
MNDNIDFDHEIRVAVQTAARSVLEPPGLADRLIAGATRQNPARRRPRLNPIITRRLLPALAVAAAVAVVALVTTSIVSNSDADRHSPTIPPAHSSAPAVPTTLSAAPVPLTTAPTVAGPAGPVGEPVPAGFVPYAVTFVDADHGWALGTTGCLDPQCVVILRTTDGAKHWVRIPAPQLTPPSQPSVIGMHLQFADALDGWAFGVDGRLFATHDGGGSWIRQAAITGTVQALQASGGYVETAVNSCPAAADCVASGTTSVFRSRVGSDGWTRVAGPIAADAGGVPQLVSQGGEWWLTVGSNLYHGVGAANPSEVAYPGGVIAVADAQHLDAATATNPGAGNATGQLWGTTTGGVHWIKTGPQFPVLTGVDSIADNTRGVLIWAESSAASYLLRTTDDGQHFNRVLDADDGGEGWSDLSFITPTEAVVTSGSGRLFISHDAGASWAPVTF